jgi:hypothetical protein
MAPSRQRSFSDLGNSELREEIRRVVRRELGAATHDRWLDAAAAAEHLRMSRDHFLKLCRNGQGPNGFGPSPRLRRWKVSVLDEWQKGTEMDNRQT